jgi:alkaline phosphatase
VPPNRLVTDSAAAATALAAGRKVNNGVVSVAHPGGPPGRRSWASPMSAKRSSAPASPC